ncbi:MAG: inositol monophosphatase family protein [Candidatus Omnitrophota bacterium]
MQNKTKEYKRIKKLAVSIAEKAGKYALKRMGNLKEIKHKEGVNNLVTDVDKKCEEMIISKINKTFPGHSILAEESGEHGAKGGIRWVIDPLDGTTNYAHTFPFFCVSIGIIFEDVVRVGVVYDPSRDELFSAEEGTGAFLNKRRISVSKQRKVQDSLLATGFAYDIDGRIANLDYFKIMLENSQALRRAGSAAIDLCYVASGRFDGFWEFNLNPWDTAAGQLIVKEAGGLVTTLNGNQFDIFKKEIIATNGLIHDEMIRLFNRRGAFPNFTSEGTGATVPSVR